ncbi:MAG: universal stress protein [Pseudomonadota bacterium]
MFIKSILCAYSGDAARGSGLRHAVKLARNHNAQLTGVLRHGTSAVSGRYALEVPENLLERLREIDAAHIEEVAKRFHQITSEAGLRDTEFVEIDPEKDGSLSAFARAFDLVVTGVPQDAAVESHLSCHPDVLALKSGRPVLVVPHGYEAEGLADRAVVAWDGKRSAARALGDAMDVLAEKSHVTLLTVGPGTFGTERIAQNMARHGISVDTRTVPRDGSIAQTLLAEAQRDGAKLMVMGAYEHSKFAHDIFGGVTTDVIAHAPFPIFLAH